MFIADCVNDGKVTDVAPKHLVQETKTQRLLTPDDTTTGLNKRVLGLKRGYLTQGRRYIVQVDVTHKGEHRRRRHRQQLFQSRRHTVKHYLMVVVSRQYI